MRSPISVRVGCDLVSIEDVERALRRHGDRYLRRVFGVNPHTGQEAPSARTLAGRFAAKEAVAKAIGVGDLPFPWTDVHIGSDPHGRPRLTLEGRVARYAAEVGFVDWDVSVTHEGCWAMSVVTGVVEARNDETGIAHRADRRFGPPTTRTDGWHGPNVGSGRSEVSGGMHDVESRIRSTLESVLGEQIRSDRIGRADDLFASGMTSHQTVQVMLGLEDEFDVEFPDELLTRSTFMTIDAMVRAIEDLT